MLLCLKTTTSVFLCVQRVAAIICRLLGLGMSAWFCNMTDWGVPDSSYVCTQCAPFSSEMAAFRATNYWQPWVIALCCAG